MNQATRETQGNFNEVTRSPRNFRNQKSVATHQSIDEARLPRIRCAKKNQPGRMPPGLAAFKTQQHFFHIISNGHDAGFPRSIIRIGFFLRKIHIQFQSRGKID